jgi:hypothetical protein
VASTRKRVFPRKHGGALVLWLANWQAPEGNKLSRSFATQGEAEAWLGKIAADPSLGYGARLADIRREDNRARAQRASPAERAAVAFRVSSPAEEEALSVPIAAAVADRSGTNGDISALHRLVDDDDDARAGLDLELRRLLERQHLEVMGELRRLGRLRRDDYENLPAVLRKVTEIQRSLGMTELHVPARHSRRRPVV